MVKWRCSDKQITGRFFQSLPTNFINRPFRVDLRPAVCLSNGSNTKGAFAIMGGKWLHRLSNINHVEKTAMCSECGEVTVYLCKSNGAYRCRNARNYDKRAYGKRNNRNPYIKYKSMTCSICGFLAEHLFQMDLHHIDGNRENNNVENLQTLCANCHRLITYKSKDLEKKTYSQNRRLYTAKHFRLSKFNK